MINALVSIVISSVISLGAYFAPHQQVPIQTVSPQIQAAIQSYVDQAMKGPIFGTTQPIAGQTYNLSGGGVSQTGTSITLSSFTIPQNGYKIPDSALSDTFYITLEPGNNTRQEIVSCTTDTQNTNGSATFTGCVRGLSPIPDYTSSSSLMFSHGGGTQVIFSNPPQFYNQFAALQNTESITGTWTFASTGSPRLDADPGAAYYTTAPGTVLVPLAQLNRTASAGAANASETTAGLVELATGKEAASSTLLGGSGARLDLPASLATSSPWAGATTSIVATGLDGRINPLFISTSTSVTYTMGNLLNLASSTFVGTTTLQTVFLTSLNIASTTIKLNGVLVRPMFGGTGSDGALTISSGTTTISLAGAKYIEKNYTSISITGTGNLAFSNPATGGSFIVLKSQGGVTITCTNGTCIDVTLLGAAGGNNTVTCNSQDHVANIASTNGNSFYLFQTIGGFAGTFATIGGNGGLVSSSTAPSTATTSLGTLQKYGGQFWVGAGGGGGNELCGSAGGGSAPTSLGGTGSGSLLIESAGALNFTGGIYAKGGNGATGTGGNGNGVGGGGGGGGGFVEILYNSLTSSSGTINAAGGIGGNSISASVTGGGGGGTGVYNGSAGTSAAAGSQSGGNGGGGDWMVQQNNNFF